MRILDRLTDTPAQVMGPLGETLVQNATAVALFGDETHFLGPRFTDSSARSLYPPEDHEHHSRVQVAQLRDAAARLGASATATLVGHLQRNSAEFASLWAAHDVGLRYSEQKRFVHPEVGELSLYCQVVVDPDELLTLLVLTATPGSESADKLRLLSVVGTYDVAGTARPPT